MTMSLQFIKASTSDVLTLNGISKRAFDSDIMVGASASVNSGCLQHLSKRRKSTFKGTVSPGGHVEDKNLV